MLCYNGYGNVKRAAIDLLQKEETIGQKQKEKEEIIRDTWQGSKKKGGLCR